MSDLQCTVFSPCGRFKVHLAVTALTPSCPEAQITLRVFPNATSSSPVSTAVITAGATHSKPLSARDSVGRTAAAPLPVRPFDTRGFRYYYTASLDAAQVAELTSSAGVRKSFRNFADMIYSGLIGTAPCVAFYVETVEEMKQRITTDIRQRRDQQRHEQASASTSSPAAVSENRVDPRAPVPDDVGHNASVGSDEASHSLVHLSLHSDTANTQALVQRFLTIDYNVDFTRAVFPIPLTIVEEGVDSHEVGEDTERGQTRTHRKEEVIALSGSDDDGDGSAPSGANRRRLNNASSVGAAELSHLREQLAAAQTAMADLHARNKKLEKENDALQHLCREKMLAMQDLCERFRGHAEVMAEVERLRRKNTELRLRMRAAEESHTEAEKRLLSVMDQRATHPHTSTAASRRESSPSPRPTSHHAQEGTPVPRPSQRGRRGLSASPPGGDLGASRQRRRPLVSPTPPPLSSRRQSQERAAATTTRSSPGSRVDGARTRSGGERTTGNRFDTPPNAAASHPRTGSYARTRRRARQASGNRFDSDLEEDDFDACGASCAMAGGDPSGGGDVPAPRGRTGARPSPSRSPSVPWSAGGTAHTPRSRGGSIPSVYKTAARGRAVDDVRSGTHSRCSSVSSRDSSIVSERLYRATTVSSRQRQDALMEDVLYRETGRLDYRQQERSTPSRRRSVFR